MRGASGCTVRSPERWLRRRRRGRGSRKSRSRKWIGRGDIRCKLKDAVGARAGEGVRRGDRLAMIRRFIVIESKRRKGRQGFDKLSPRRCLPHRWVAVMFALALPALAQKSPEETQKALVVAPGLEAG